MRNPVHWQVLLDENEWDAEAGLDELLQTQAHAPPADGAARPVNWHLLTTLAVLCLVLILGAALIVRQRALAGVALIEGELGAVVELERYASQKNDEALLATLSDRRGWEERARQNFALPGAEEQPTIAVEIENVELSDGLALVQVLVQDSRLPLAWREARFYRETPGGWLRTAPQPVFWGSRQSLQSEHFLFHFHQADRLAVEEAAPRLDANYARIHTLLALPLEAEQTPLVVDVRVLDLPQARRAEVYADGTFVAWSPLLLARPEGISPADLLVESVSSALITQSIHKMTASLPVGWPTFVTSLHLWLTWEVDSRLTLSQSLYWSISRVEQWRIAQSANPSGEGITAFPAEYREMCQILRALELTPYYLGMLMSCKEGLPDLTPTDRLAGPNKERQTDGNGGKPRSEWAEQVEAASREPLRFTNWPIDQALLYHYLNTRFGEGAVPHLLATSRNHYSWQTLIPAAFDVTYQEFEAGWKTYLQETFAQTSIIAPSTPHPPSVSPR